MKIRIAGLKDGSQIIYEDTPQQDLVICPMYIVSMNTDTGVRLALKPLAMFMSSSEEPVNLNLTDALIKYSNIKKDLVDSYKANRLQLKTAESGIVLP